VSSGTNRTTAPGIGARGGCGIHHHREHSTRTLRPQAVPMGERGEAQRTPVRHGATANGEEDHSKRNSTVAPAIDSTGALPQPTWKTRTGPDLGASRVRSLCPTLSRVGPLGAGLRFIAGASVQDKCLSPNGLSQAARSDQPSNRGVQRVLDPTLRRHRRSRGLAHWATPIPR
jgi:hypothetical protein